MVWGMKVMMVLLFLKLLGQVASMDPNTAFVSGMAELRCQFSNPNKYSTQQLIVSWERPGEPLVVAELYEGQRQYKHIHKSYINRTTNFKPNVDLQMFNITLQDKGKYTCNVRKKTKYTDLIHKSEYILNVLANFSVPQISGGLPVVKKDMIVSFRCSSTDGFPKPHGVSWMVSDENGTQVHNKICNMELGPPCTIKNNSETFIISSELTLMIKSNTSITCTVLAHHNISSLTLYIAVEDEPILSTKENDNLIYILPIVILIAIMGVGYIAYRINRKRCTLGPLQNIREVPTTTARNNSVTKQQDETTVFIDNREEVNVS